MRLLVSGASGLVGSALVRHLETRGDLAVPLVRRDDSPGVRWDPKTGRFDDVLAEGFDAVVHLAGENVASGRWTEQRRSEIRDSRVGGTRLLTEHLTALSKPPRVLVCASAVGFYGDGGGGDCTEAAPRGRGFLAEVCRDWEAACEPASARGIRVVVLRIGLVLAAEGGALPRMLPAFKLGLGARLGDGKQWMSWITLGDLVRVIEHAIAEENLRGPVNAVAPEPVTNAAFTMTLARVLGRPAFLSIPALVLRAALGCMAEELLLSGARVVPARLQDAGFPFEHGRLEPGLRALMGR